MRLSTEQPDFVPYECADCGDLFQRHPASGADYCDDCTEVRSTETREKLSRVPGLSDALDDARNWLERFVAFPHEHGSTAVARMRSPPPGRRSSTGWPRTGQ